MEIIWNYCPSTNFAPFPLSTVIFSMLACQIRSQCSLIVELRTLPSPFPLSQSCPLQAGLQGLPPGHTHGGCYCTEFHHKVFQKECCLWQWRSISMPAEVHRQHDPNRGRTKGWQNTLHRDVCNQWMCLKLAKQPMLYCVLPYVKWKQFKISITSTPALRVVFNFIPSRCCFLLFLLLYTHNCWQSLP